MRRIVVCADGTWNVPDKKDRGKRKPSNVVKIARAVLPLCDDGTTQIVFYDEGIGTHWTIGDKLIGGVTGVGMSRNIIDCYRFIVQNYAPGDELFFFGFSRGAFTVRSLAALINIIGLIPKDNVFWLPEGYNIYRISDKKKRLDEAEKFKRENKCRTVNIRFIGVFDTVGGLGIPLGIFKHRNERVFQFHDMSLPGCVNNAFHALAIDEVRRQFKPSLWDTPVQADQTMEQRWFAGVHTNIGGGYEHDGLANIPLYWFKEKAEKQGLEFNQDFLAHYRPYRCDELRNSYSITYGFKKHREIGTTKHGNEKVDESAVQRMKNVPPCDKKIPKYAPKSLIKWLKKKGES